VRYRLLAVDVDGTLVDRHDGLSEGTRRALQRAMAGGIRVVLATGRRYGRALPVLRRLGIEVPLVAASGALVKDPRDHHTIYAARFPPGVLERCLEVITACGFEPVVCADTYMAGFEFYVAQRQVRGAELAEYLEVNADDGRLWPGLPSHPPPGVFAGFAMGTRQQMLELEREILRRLPGRVHSHVLRSPKYRGFMYEFTPAGVTKWTAISRLAAGWGVAEGAICAVGDDVNDIPMLRAAGLGVAMANAPAEVKRAADRVAPSQEEDGLVEVVQWLLDG